jgi:lipid-A-disaccharide synthase
MKSQTAFENRMSESREILIVAGEASSALYAQRLLEHWRRSGRDVRAFGVGSHEMESLGFERLGRSEELAVVGLQEVIRHFPLIRRTYHSLLEAARQRKPRFALLLDYPDFNLRLAKDLHRLGIPVVYYISPQLWAWRKGRVKIVKKYISKMLVLFPFEVDFYQRHGVSVEFVGHPALDELEPRLLEPSQQAERRQRFGVRPNERVLALMPGSRQSELNHHLDVQLEVAAKLGSQVRPILLLAPGLDREQMRARIAASKWGREVSVQIIQDRPLEMISIADVVLCASGTATLMVGLMEKPMVIMYRMNSISAAIARLLVRSTSFFGMVNLIMGREIVPERFQESASAELLTTEIRALLENPSRQEQMRSDLRQMKMKLGERGATERVDRALQEFL